MVARCGARFFVSVWLCIHGRSGAQGGALQRHFWLSLPSSTEELFFTAPHQPGTVHVRRAPAHPFSALLACSPSCIPVTRLPLGRAHASIQRSHTQAVVQGGGALRDGCRPRRPPSACGCLFVRRGRRQGGRVCGVHPVSSVVAPISATLVSGRAFAAPPFPALPPLPPACRGGRRLCLLWIFPIWPACPAEYCGAPFFSRFCRGVSSIRATAGR